MKKVIAIQHTQSFQHTNKMIGSWTDWDLTQLGTRQANRIGKRLSAELENEKYVMYSSDLSRTKRTAEIVSDFLGIKPIFTSALREFNFGEACGKSKQWAKENGKTDTDPFCTGFDERPFAGAETMREVWERVTNFYNQVISKTDENIIVVSHGGTLSMLFAIWDGLGIEAFDRYVQSPSAGGVSFLQEDESGKRVISRLNDRTYIQ
jgi:Fructose-2,6-bisphosphatase